MATLLCFTRDFPSIWKQTTNFFSRFLQYLFSWINFHFENYWVSFFPCALHIVKKAVWLLPHYVANSHPVSIIFVLFRIDVALVWISRSTVAEQILADKSKFISRHKNQNFNYRAENTLWKTFREISRFLDYWISWVTGLLDWWAFHPNARIKITKLVDRNKTL